MICSPWRGWNRASRSCRWERCPIRELVADAVASLRAQARAHGVELAVEDLPEGTVRADRDAIHQVFTNLIENALKYGGSEGKVRIGANLEGIGTGISCSGFRSGDRVRASATTLRTLLPRGQGALAGSGWDRAWSGDRETHCAEPWRPGVGGEQAGPRFHVLLHGSGGVFGCAGCLNRIRAPGGSSFPALATSPNQHLTALPRPRERLRWA